MSREIVHNSRISWYGNQYGIYLATVHHGRRYVMGFSRMGMQGAQPNFVNPQNHTLSPASDLVKFVVGDREVTGFTEARSNDSVYRYDISEIDAPDAKRLVELWNACRGIPTEELIQFRQSIMAGNVADFGERMKEVD